ncbi:MAG TPA: hypothetical protein VIY90_11555 [Steroidobacteraceae bacterium]
MIDEPSSGPIRTLFDPNWSSRLKCSAGYHLDSKIHNADDSGELPLDGIDGFKGDRNQGYPSRFGGIDRCVAVRGAAPEECSRCSRQGPYRTALIADAIRYDTGTDTADDK